MTPALSFSARAKRAGRYFAAVFCAAFVPVFAFWTMCSPPYEPFSGFAILFWVAACAVPALLFALLLLALPRRRRWHRFAAAAVPVLLAVAWLVFVFPCGELFCPFYPSIDTEYAPGYTDRGFFRIRPGMTEAQVRSLIGEPFYTNEVWSYNPPGEDEYDGVYWHYSDDGKCTFGDFAWLQRNVVFTNGVVKCLTTPTSYD